MIRLSTLVMALFAVGFSFAQITVSSSTVTDPTCPGSCNGSIQVTPAGGVIPYTYVWQDGTGSTIGSNASSINALCAGNYSVTISDASSGGGTTTIYSEDFETGAASWSLSNVVGPQGADPNFFTVSDNEGGVAPGGCGVANNGDNTLHITSVFNSTGGAAYDAGGLCGLLFCPETHVRAQSGLINTSGNSNLTLSFDYIANGDQPNDQATVWINPGSGWAQLGGALSSTVCANGQGLWTAYSVVLPASCDNIANLQIGIQWDNNDDGVGTDPSVAINNILITTPSAGGSNPPITQNFTLVDPAAISITNVATTAANCNTADGTITITANGGSGALQYSIDNGATFQSGNTFNTVLPGNYTIAVQDPNGCQVTSATTVPTANGPAITNVAAVDPTCNQSDGSIDITANSPNGGLQYSIDNGASFVGGNVFAALAGGTYPIVVQDASGCQVTSSVTLNPANAPAVNAGADFAICAGSPAILNATVLTPNPATIAWDNGVLQNTSFTPAATTTYTVTVTETASGCTATDQITVTVDPIPAITISVNTTSGCAPLVATFTSNTVNSNSCTWTFSDGQSFTGCGNQTVTFNTPGCVDLAVVATSANGCLATVNYPSITCVTGGPVASFTPTPSLLSSESAISTMINNSTGATNYAWNFGDGSNSTAVSPTHSFPVGAAGVYTVILTATDNNGCQDQDTAKITVEEELLYYVPNTFTPDGDEFNQVFQPVFTSGFDLYDFNFTVFNRWGETIFESKDASVGWDGSYMGMMAQEGQYTWRIEFKTNKTDERVLLYGHLNLLK